MPAISDTVYELARKHVEATIADERTRMGVIRELDAMRAPEAAAPSPAGSRFDRQAEIRKRAAHLIEQGQDVLVAERNAARAIAYERAESLDVDLDSMTVAELREHLATFNTRDLNPNNQPDAEDTRTLAELRANVEAEWAEHPSRVSGEGVRAPEPQRERGAMSLSGVWTEKDA